MPLLQHQAQQQQVAEEGDGQRLDNWLFKHLKHVPKSRVYRMIRSGEVRVNRGRAKANTRLAQDDWVRIPPHQQNPTPQAEHTQKQAANLEEAVLFEDHELLILNKPAGWPVHGGTQHSLGVIEVMRQARPKAPYLELVHRLDKATSGCLAIAKKRSTLVRLQEQWGTAEVEKTYQALVWDAWDVPKRITLPISRCSGQQAGPHARIDHEQGKPACTWLRQVARKQDMTWVEARLGTGRTHQIRLHTSSQDHPVIGDTRYGQHARNRQAEAAGWQGMALHASRLMLPGWAPFEAPIPQHWQAFWEAWQPQPE